MYNTFKQCQDQLDGIQAVDYFLARELCKALDVNHEKTEENDLLFHSIMAASQALRNGHSCLKLDEESCTDNETLCWHNPEEDKPGYAVPKLADWHYYLSQLAITPEDDQPLVYEQQRLYLRRYWQFEEELARAIRALMHSPIEQQAAFDSTQAQQVMEQLFPPLSADKQTS